MPLARLNPGNLCEGDIALPSVFPVVEGLSSSTALHDQEKDGFNEIPGTRKKKFYHFVIETLREPMVGLLIACGAIYLILGDLHEALLLIGFLMVIVAITLFQETKAERALEALRDLSSPRALVLRDGEKKRIAGREVVKNDVVFVAEGDRVPADGVLLQGMNVATDESLLTGESLPVDKIRGAPLYAGTLVVHGQGGIRVNAIGQNTELGKIGKSIQLMSREPTQLEAQTRAMVWRLTWVASSLCFLIVGVYGIFRHQWLTGFLAGLSLAMAILPNELPAVLTIFLALGAWRMTQRRVLTRRMPALENLGAITVLCVDKTGTLTLNRMSIQLLYADGDYFTLSSLSHGKLPEKFHEILEYGVLASRPDPFDPMEKAFLEASQQFLEGTEHLHSDWSLRREYPLSPQLLSITQAWGSKSEGWYRMGAKGAPEAIIDLCHLKGAVATSLTQRAAAMASRGLRVLAVAKAKIDREPLPEKQHDFDFEFVGLVGIADPIRPGVPHAVAECQSAGIRVLMITGDHPSTAQSLAQQVGLGDAGNVVTGVEVDHMSDAELREVARKASVFSRMVPAQKLRLVQELKEDGEVVAMTGDGVNDAPALKSAHIGIAMGARGTDVARESSAIVLLDDDFTSIVEAIKMGRRVYANLQDGLIYLLTVHVPIAGMSVLPVLLKLPLVLLPVHIAFLHLIIEPACSIVYEAQPASPTLMKRPPRKVGDKLFNRALISVSLSKGGAILAALILVYFLSIYRGQGESEVRAITFTTLIFSNLALIMRQKPAERSHQGDSQRNVSLAENRIALGIVAATLVVLLCVLYIPTVCELFRMGALGPIDLLICLVIGIFGVRSSISPSCYR